MNVLHTKMSSQFNKQWAKNLLSNRLRWGFFCAAIFMGGCTSIFDSQKTAPAPIVVAPPAPPAPTSLTAEAENTLKTAEQSVIEAKVKRVLWSAAVEQLAQAKAAAKIFDSETTLKHAKEVIALCDLSSKQAQSAPVAW
jgi:hypothetical protein